MALMNNESTGNGILYLNFNQDNGCFACATEQGFGIYNCNPFKEIFRREFVGGGIGVVEMLYRSNILALVGGGKCPRYNKNSVIIWDDQQSKVVGKLMFKSPVQLVKLKRTHVIVVLETIVYVYNFNDLSLLDSIITAPNPKGLCAISTDKEHNVIALPGKEKGSVRIQLYDIQDSKLIQAHKGDIVSIALTQDGSRLATASDKGTLIRIFNTTTGQRQQELRRGVDPTVIYNISFNADNNYVACSSKKGTVHIYNISKSKETMSSTVTTNNAALPIGSGDAGSSPVKTDSKSGLSFMKGVLPKYFSSEWSFAKFAIPNFNSNIPYICGFGSEPRTILCLSGDGVFYKASFEEGGDCELLFQKKFIDE